MRSRDGSELLDAPRWRWPRFRRGALLRSGAAASLLLLAAGIVYAEPSPPRSSGSRPTACASARLPDTPPAGMVGFPLHISAPGALAVVHAGHRVDVLAPSVQGGRATLVAADLRVLRVVAGSPPDPDGGVLYLAARPAQARALAGIASDVPVSVTVRAR